MRRRGVFVRRIGELKRDKSLVVIDFGGEILNVSLDVLRNAWRSAF